MRRLLGAVVVAALAVALLPNVARAWDHVYDGNGLPSSPSLGAGQWYASPGMDTSICSSDGGVLHIADTNASMSALFSKYAIPTWNTPVTVEARVRVVSGIASVLVSTPSFTTFLRLSASSLSASFAYPSAVIYDADFAVLRTVRVATNAVGDSWVWLDGTLVAQGRTTEGNQTGLAFGGGGSVSDSYWDYVAYSNAFVPVPEPPSLFALLAGLGALGAMMKKRRP